MSNLRNQSKSPEFLWDQEPKGTFSELLSWVALRFLLV